MDLITDNLKKDIINYKLEKYKLKQEIKYNIYKENLKFLSIILFIIFYGILTLLILK